MWHTTFIVLHATTAVVALFAGGIALGDRAWFGVYYWSLLAMELFLLLAIAAEWSSLDGTVRAVFAALAGLGLVMVGRAHRARRPTSGGGRTAYVDRLGFTLVALVDAFLVILVLSWDAPGWAVALLGVVVAMIGHLILRRVKAGTTVAGGAA